jgi:cleavage and polyadenylation specificity factor subunit 3
MTVYQTYINVLNSDMKAQFEESNPFVFNHVNHLTNSNGLDGVGPCVVLATPSMLQSGLSRDLFESWCGDSKNGVIICDFAVQGTLAREILSDCKTVTSRTGQELPLRMTVDAISFSAHADYPQTQQFLDALAPPHVVLGSR